MEKICVLDGINTLRDHLVNKSKIAKISLKTLKNIRKIPLNDIK